MVLHRGSFLRPTRRPAPVFLQIDPSPYLGFAIVLLCVFMTATPYTHPGGDAVDLAVVSHAHKILRLVRYDAISIVVTRDGSVYFRNNKVVPEELPNCIHDAILNGAEKRIYLKADARSSYRDVSRLLPYIQLAGVSEITFPVRIPIAAQP